MTISEAKSILHCPDAHGGIYGKKYGEALNMAMEALKREPCEDCISREKAIGQCGFGLNYMQIAERLKNIPSVTPTRSKGKWIYLNDEIEIYDHWYQCSVCHKESFEYHFCPYCGAEMVGTTKRN